MIIDYAKLVETLDASHVPNQEVEARRAFAINFGSEDHRGHYHHQLELDTADGIRVYVLLDESNRIIGLEFV